MTRTVVWAAVCSGLLFMRAAESEWTLASNEDRGVEFQVNMPTKNSCEVRFRDLSMRKKTSLTATIQYLPHRLAGKRFETDTVRLVIGAGSDSEHIGSCEAVVSVNVFEVRRE